MKTISFFLIVTLLLSHSLIFSQPIDASKYFPLSIGNKWVFSWYSTQYGSSGRFIKQITSSMNTNGHTYFDYGGYYLRVDSVNGNVYQRYQNNGCQWSANERMKDSLSTRLYDTVRYNCGANYKTLADTNQRLFAGSLRSTKNFRLGNNGIIYIKNFGVLEYYTQSGNVFYVENLIGCVINGVLYGDTSLTAITVISTEIPTNFSLSQNYPNPFNPVTKIRFSIQADGKGQMADVKLIVYDVLGREVTTLVNESATGGLKPGTYEVEFDGTNYVSGVYFYKLSVSASTSSFSTTYSETKKMLMIK